jgi:hypothetical protein
MRYATAAAFRRALETRLAERSRSAGLPLVRLRRIVVFERLLARLMEAAPDRSVLKGGLALELTFASRGTHLIPASLPSPSPSWAVPYAKLAAEVKVDRDVLAGHQAAAHFLDAVLFSATAPGARWDPAVQAWTIDT